MEEIDELINEICKKQNFEEILLEIKESKQNKKITNVLQTLEDNKDIEDSLKRKIYGEIYDYVYDINKNYEKKIKNIFILGIKETLNQLRGKNLLEKEGRAMEEIEELIKNIKTNGITRKLDELGRLVIPSEYRNGKVVDGVTPVKVYNIGDYVVVELLDKVEKDKNTKKFDELGRIVVQIEIRKKLNWNSNDKIKIWDCEKYFIMQKEKNECVFCGRKDNLIEYKNQLLCEQCKKELKTI